MIVVDVEASGTEPSLHSIVSVGAVDFRNPEYQFYEECRIWDGAHVMDEALAVNGFTREQITDPSKQPLEALTAKFINWALNCEEQTFAGQNPSFDRDFLKSSAMRGHLSWPFAHRTVDLHSVAYAHILGRGIPPPLKNKHSALNLDSILEYVGIPGGEPKPHNALTGAKSAAECFSRLLYKKNLLPEFAEYPLALA